MGGGLGRAELEFVTSITVPLYWIREGDSGTEVTNGSAFFLDAGEGVFGVTAYHVIKKLKQDRSTRKVITCQIGHDLVFDIDIKNSIIDSHCDIDIVTFRITVDEIKSIGKNFLTGYQKIWPPQPPTKDRGVYFSGFPASERIGPSSGNVIEFGAVPLSGVASSISDVDVSSSIDREYLIDVMGKGLLPENYDFRGISGGPMLTVIEAPSGLRSWSLAGVIYKGPNTDPDEAIPGVEIISARRAYFIQPDGRLNTQLWDSLNFSKKKKNTLDLLQ